MDVTFREAEPRDLPAIIRLLADDPLGSTREASSEGDVVDERYAQALRAISDDPRQLQLVAVVDDRVVGTLQLSFIPSLTFAGGERAQIEGVRVDAAERGHGLGHQMVAWCIDEARRRGCHVLQLTTNKQRTDALRFYESLGFEATHEGMKLGL
jgi:GNAT superfamily N-acetyltransferase